MGTNPYKERCPTWKWEVKWARMITTIKPNDVNVQEIGTNPQFPGPGRRGLGTNFTRVKKNKNRLTAYKEWIIKINNT